MIFIFSTLRHLKHGWATLFLNLSLAVVLNHVAAQSAAADILSKVDAYRAPGPHFVFNVRLSDTKGNKLGLRVMVRDRTKGLVRYVEPARTAGRSILYIGRNMWVYVPGSRRALRVSPQQQVLGGVSSADLARIVYAGDYQIKNSTRGKAGTTVLRLSGKGRGAAYARIDLTIASDYRPLQAVFYAANGKRKLKTMYFEGYTPILGRLRPMRLRIVDHMRGDAITIMRFSGMRLKETPSAWFQPSFLERLP